MRIADIMTPGVELTTPQATLREAAATMASADAGILPVQENDRIVGMISDRDIAIRAVAEGKGGDCAVGDVMTRDIKYCFDDEEIADVARNMAEIKVQRLPVMNRDKRLVGIVSLGDMAVKSSGEASHTALSGMKQPGGPHD